MRQTHRGVETPGGADTWLKQVELGKGGNGPSLTSLSKQDVARFHLPCSNMGKGGIPGYHPVSHSRVYPQRSWAWRTSVLYECLCLHGDASASCDDTKGEIQRATFLGPRTNGRSRRVPSSIPKPPSSRPKPVQTPSRARQHVAATQVCGRIGLHDIGRRCAMRVSLPVIICYPTAVLLRVSVRPPWPPMVVKRQASTLATTGCAARVY